MSWRSKPEYRRRIRQRGFRCRCELYCTEGRPVPFRAPVWGPSELVYLRTQEFVAEQAAVGEVVAPTTCAIAAVSIAACLFRWLVLCATADCCKEG